MSEQPMEIRLARLDGAYEQIDRRLADLRQDMERGFAAIDQRFGGIDQRFAALDQKCMWLIGLIIATWMTTILTILFRH